VRDFQRAKLYAWERAVLEPTVEEDIIGFEGCNKLARKVWRSLNAAGKPPEILEDPEAPNGFYYLEKHRIHLPKEWYYTARWYTIHELTHALGVHNHGPEFCSVYGQLLERFGDWTGVKQSMQSYGLKLI